MSSACGNSRSHSKIFVRNDHTKRLRGTKSIHAYISEMYIDLKLNPKSYRILVFYWI